MLFGHRVLQKIMAWQKRTVYQQLPPNYNLEQICKNGVIARKRVFDGLDLRGVPECKSTTDQQYKKAIAGLIKTMLSMAMPLEIVHFTKNKIVDDRLRCRRNGARRNKHLPIQIGNNTNIGDPGFVFGFLRPAGAPLVNFQQSEIYCGTTSFAVTYHLDLDRALKYGCDIMLKAYDWHYLVKERIRNN